MATVKIAPSKKEVSLLNDMFNEASFMGGTNVSYRTVKTVNITEVSSEMYEWNDPVNFDVIYDERPKVQLLKRLSWYSEDSTIQPKIMYVPAKVNNEQFLARRGDLVEVTPAINGIESVFQVSEVRTDLLPLWWVCNIVPFRKQEKPDTEPTRQNKWLNV